MGRDRHEYFIVTQRHHVPIHCEHDARSEFGVAPLQYGSYPERMGSAMQTVDIGVGRTPMRMHNIKFTFGDHAPNKMLESPNA